METVNGIERLDNYIRKNAKTINKNFERISRHMKAVDKLFKTQKKFNNGITIFAIVAGCFIIELYSEDLRKDKKIEELEKEIENLKEMEQNREESPEHIDMTLKTLKDINERFDDIESIGADMRDMLREHEEELDYIRRDSQINTATVLYNSGLTISEIAKKMGFVNDSSVRELLDERTDSTKGE